MANKTKIFTCLLLISLLTSCNKSTLESATNMPSISPHANVKFDCPKIEISMADLKSSGTLILQGADKTYLMDMVSMAMAPINKPNKALLEFSVSPNQEWIAYYESEFNQPDANLIVAGVNNQVYKTLPWESKWGAFRWLDNERLIIRTIPQSEPNSVTNYNTDFLVLNPFTGERQTVKVDYPNIYNLYPLPDWDGWGVTVYNQALTRVVYLEGAVSGPLYYVLWDLQKKSQITNLHIVEDLDANPRWSPDGEQFAVAPSLFSKMKQYPSYELYSVTKDGDTKQLTHLTDYYPRVYIADLSWSPDSRYIAFWFSHWQQSESPSYGSSVGDRYLGVLDTETGLVTDYCINGENDASIGLRIYPPPLWSPDGKQVVIQSQVTKDSFKTILIDIKENRAFHIADDMEPVGWMVSP